MYFSEKIPENAGIYDGSDICSLYGIICDTEWKTLDTGNKADTDTKTGLALFGDTDTLYQFEPYTGDAYYRFPARYVLSPFPMLAAVISRFTGVRPAVVCHTVYPFFFIPLAYFVYALLAEKLFDGKKEEKRLFLIGVSLIQLYSGFSSLTAGKFLLIRIWQGKAILAAVILPYLLYFALEYGSREYLKLREWLLLACVMVAGCFVSSMGIMLAAIEVGVLSLVCVIRYKNIRLLLQVALSNGLNLLLAGIYLYMR